MFGLVFEHMRHIRCIGTRVVTFEPQGSELLGSGSGKNGGS